MVYVPCIGNSSYSFWWILLKLYRCFKDGLEICILFFQNPEIIFYHFFRIFNLDIFRALILQICIWSIYLVSATPPTVFGESFWNFTVVFRMVWRYAYCFLRILKLFFLHFNLDIFSSLYATDMYREYMPCIGNPAYSFRPILLKLYRYFAAFLWFHMRNLSLAGYNCSGGASCMACSFIVLCNLKTLKLQMDRVKWIWYLSHMRAAKVQASLHIRAVLPEPLLLAHTSSESRGTFRQKARSLAPLIGWACAVKICDDGMLEDTNSLDGAQIIFHMIYEMVPSHSPSQ